MPGAASAPAGYRIEVVGLLPAAELSWLSDLGAVSTEQSASALIVRDQSALVGVVNRLHGLGITIHQISRLADHF